MNKELENLTENIKKCHCKNCGSKNGFNNSKCFMCNKESEDIINYTKKINQLIESKKTYSFEELLDLYIINQKINEPIYLNILEKNNFKQELDKKVKSIEDKLINKELNTEDNALLIQLVDKDVIDKKFKFEIINLNMHELLAAKLNIPVDYKLMLLKEFTEFYIKSNYNVKEVECTYKDLEDDGGRYKYNPIARNFTNGLVKIEYNKKYFENNLNNDRYLNILDTMFHEITHLESNIYLPKKESVISLQYIKDQALSVFLDGYYKENYRENTDETMARLGGIYKTLDYLDKINLSINVDKSEVENKLKEESKLLFSENRTYQGEKTTLTDIFDSKMKNPDVLAVYPMLKLEYIEDNGKVVRKSYNELMSDYNKIKEKGKNKDVDELYTVLLERQAKKEMFINDSNKIENSKDIKI